MNILIFDTETISLNRPFCYNLGYIIVDDKGKTLQQRNLIIKQIYDNKPLFATAYYYCKKPLYISAMKGKKAKKVLWGVACKTMQHDIEKYNIQIAYAYNARFDIQTMSFNHSYFNNKIRPLDSVKVCDIMDYLDPLTNTKQYKDYCFNNGFVTAHTTPRPRKTAESVYSYITQQPNYKEEHTALEDSKIEYEILKTCLKLA